MTESLKSIYFALVNFYLSAPFFLQIIWIITAIEIVLVILSALFLSRIRIKYQIKYRKYKALKNKYQEILINYIYLTEEEEEDKIKIVKKLKRKVSRKMDREVIKKLILTLHNDLAGELAVLLENLYHNLDLVKYSLRKLKNPIWYIKIKGLRELTQMNVKGVYTDTLKLINHKNILLRREVQLTLVKLYQYEGLKFLENLDYQISEWQQIQLIEEIQSIRNIDLPDIEPWLHSNNDSVVIFTLKLVKLFNQIQTQETLIKLVMHPSQHVRRSAIGVLGYFKITDSKIILKQIFKNSVPETQLYIIQALSELAEKKDIPFFEKQVNNEDFDVKRVAIEALKELKPYMLTTNLSKN